MTTYAPDGFGPTTTVGPHEGVRVTFAETRSMFTPDAVEEADFRETMGRLIDNIAQGGAPVAPASDITVAPGELAATIDFLVIGGPLTVAQLASQLTDSLYGPLSFARRTYIRSIEHIGVGGGATWGTQITTPTADPETNPLNVLGGIGAVTLLAVAVGAFVFFAPEIRTAVRVRQRA